MNKHEKLNAIATDLAAIAERLQEALDEQDDVDGDYIVWGPCELPVPFRDMPERMPELEGGEGSFWYANMCGDGFPVDSYRMLRKDYLPCLVRRLGEMHPEYDVFIGNGNYVTDPTYERYKEGTDTWVSRDNRIRAEAGTVFRCRKSVHVEEPCIVETV